MTVTIKIRKRRISITCISYHLQKHLDAASLQLTNKQILSNFMIYFIKTFRGGAEGKAIFNILVRASVGYSKQCLSIWLLSQHVIVAKPCNQAPCDAGQPKNIVYHTLPVGNRVHLKRRTHPFETSQALSHKKKERKYHEPELEPHYFLSHDISKVQKS